ncbi:ABC transporter substrate-binding protein [Treponema parvum]|uniref:ABC transporter substrate-binding protein n=2 Tax=Treponema parvum TaxID=138851 RepID=A0A975IEU8_9SPIR|nr:ABC transporter substrate-binding protein [Treponema parvum]
MMKKFIVPAAMIAVCSMVFAAGQKETVSAGANANVSGKVVIYTSMYQDIIDAIDTELETLFPNCDVEFFYGGTGKLQAKIAAEKESGKLGCDILMVAEPAYALELKEAGLLHKYKTPEAANLAFAYDADGSWYPVRICTMVLAYNPEKYTKGKDIPVTFKEFATDPRLSGYISMSNPLTSGTAMASIVGLLGAYGEDYFKALNKQKVAVESGSVALTKLETGECKQIMILEESVLKKREEEGSKIECIYPEDGVLSCPSAIMTVEAKYSANNNIPACEVLTDWFLSKEGQKAIVKGWMHSVRKDVDYTPYDSLPNDKMFAKTIDIDWEKCYKERDTIRTMFEEKITIKK